MAFNYVRLVGMSFVPSGSSSSGSAIYTHSSASYATASYIRSITLHNTNIVDESCALFLVPSGSTLNLSASRFYLEAIQSGSTRMIEFVPPGMMLTVDADALVAGTTSANKVTVMVFGGGE